MKRIWLILLIAPLLAAGCARHYVITKNNGYKITTRGKPKLEGSSYVYKDLQGEQVRIPSGSVAEIAPASMMEQKDPFKPKTSR